MKIKFIAGIIFSFLCFNFLASQNLNSDKDLKFSKVLFNTYESENISSVQNRREYMFPLVTVPNGYIWKIESLGAKSPVESVIDIDNFNFGYSLLLDDFDVLFFYGSDSTPQLERRTDFPIYLPSGSYEFKVLVSYYNCYPESNTKFYLSGTEYRILN